jgi:hypothetical protein
MSATIHPKSLFEMRMLRKIFSSERDETGGWRKLYNEGFHNLYSTTINIRLIKSKGQDMQHTWER